MMVLSAEFAMGDLIAVLTIGILLAMAVALVAAEEAIARTNSVRAEAMADSLPDPERVRPLLRLLEEPEAVLNPLRLVVLMVQLTETTLVAVLANKFLAWPLVVGIVAANICVVFVVAEALPRTLGILRTDRLALGLARPAELLVRFWPIRILADFLIKITNVVVPGRGLRKGPFSTPEELIALADAAVEDSVLEKGERDLIESVIEFGDTVVREVMVPRTDMTSVEQGRDGRRSAGGDLRCRLLPRPGPRRQRRRCRRAGLRQGSDSS